MSLTIKLYPQIFLKDHQKSYSLLRNRCLQAFKNHHNSTRTSFTLFFQWTMTDELNFTYWSEIKQMFGFGEIRFL